MRFLVSWFTPTGLLVLISWISFFIPPDLVPGRMALLVTIFLMLVNIDNTGNTDHPKAEGLTAMELWIVACMIFVAMALFEYAILLNLCFGGQRIYVADVKGKNVNAEIGKADFRRKLTLMDRRAAIFFACCFALFNVYFWIHLHMN